VQGQLSGVLAGAATRSDARQFSVFGVAEARNGLLLSFGAETNPMKKGRAFVAYERLFVNHGFEHGFAAGLSLGW
jgi:hypothetical protein